MRGVLRATCRRIGRAAGVAVVAGAVLPAAGQTRAVTLEVNPEDVGVAGLARPGVWTPLRVELTNQTSDYREVIVEWTMPDADGDRVRYERRVALNPDATVDAWTYGALPPNNVVQPYPVRVLDGETRALLDQSEVAAQELAELDEPIIGVFGGSSLGLGFARVAATRHEVVRVLNGVRLDELPDRWHGLSMFRALVWAPAGGGSPTALDVGPASLVALEQWVRRGGHLILLWPTAGQTWTDTPIGDLLPFEKDAAVRVNGPIPAWLGTPTPGGARDMAYHVFRLRDEPGATVLLSDAASGDPAAVGSRPVVVARRHGLGRVTVSGIDWSQPPLSGLGLPNGRVTPWHAVFGWTSPAYTEAAVETLVRANEMLHPRNQNTASLGEVFTRRVAMRETAGPALLAAVVVFLVYWLVAGPIADTALSKRDQARRRWVGFAAAGLVFTGVCWVGALLVRPGTTRVAHVSVLDVEPAAGTARVTSFVSAFIPRFGEAALELAPGLDDADNDALITTVAADRGDGGSSAFLDPQAYTVDAARPASALVPVRSTAKSLRLDFFGGLRPAADADPREPAAVAWDVPRATGGPIELDGTRWPRGTLTHGLSGPLLDVQVVYCPGDGEPPFVWRPTRRWEPGLPLDVSPPAQRAQVDYLVRTPPGLFYTAEREFKNEGLLGKRIDTAIGSTSALGVNFGPGGTTGSVADASLIVQLEMLSFFDMLPPPNYRDVRGFGARRQTVFRRPTGQGLDLSSLTATPCLLVIGHLPDSSLPAPLTIAGRVPPSHGWTTIRCVFALE